MKHNVHLYGPVAAKLIEEQHYSTLTISDDGGFLDTEECMSFFLEKQHVEAFRLAAAAINGDLPEVRRLIDIADPPEATP